MNYLGSSMLEPARVTGHVLHPRELDAALLTRWEELRGGRYHYFSPFYAPQFTQAVGTVRGDARVAVFEAGGEVVGFLPFHRVGKKIAKPIGGHLNDYQGAILRRGLDLSDPQLLEAAGIVAYDFNHLPDPLAERLELASENGSSPRMDIAGGYDAYVAGRDRSFRRGYSAMNRKLRKMAREVGEPSFLFDSREPEHARAHAWMRNALYRKAGVQADFESGWEGEVFAFLRTIKDGDFRSVLNVLMAGEMVVAAHFGIISRGVMHWWFPAYAESAGRYSPGIAIVDHCAREAKTRGIAAIDFGRGSERYKRFFATSEIPLLAGSVVRPNTLAAGLRRIAHGLVLPLEDALPDSMESYPRRIAERLVTGPGIPRSE